MTTPKVATINRGGSRFYVHPEDSSIKVPGVTSVVGMLPKPFLGPWQAKMVAEEAVNNFATLASFLSQGTPAGRTAAVDWLKNTARRYTNSRADLGTEAHDIFEQMASGTTPRAHPDFDGFVANFSAFLDEFQPEFLYTEETVWSETEGLGYAGSFDAVAKIAGEVVYLDYKTGKSVYPDVALQLSAYRFADYIIRPDGGRVPLPQADGGAVLSIHETPGDWSLYPVRVDKDVHEAFLHLRRVFDWDKDTSKTVLGKPVDKASRAKKRTRNKRAA